MSFYDTIGNIGEALGGIPAGINTGLAPFTTWENIRTRDVANDIEEQKARNALFEQQAREAAPNYYGDLTSAAQTQNQLNAFNRQQSLAQGQYGVSPEFQRQLQGLDPSSPEYAIALARGQSQFNPFGVPGFVNQTVMPMRNLAANEQVAATYGKNILANQYGLDPSEIQLSRGPTGEWVASAFGEQLQIPREALITMGGFSGGASAYRDAQLRNMQQFETANANIYKALVQDEMKNDPTFNAAMNNAQKQFDDVQKNLNQVRANALSTPEQIAAAEQAYNQANATVMQLIQTGATRGMQRRGLGVGGGASTLYGGSQAIPTAFQVPTTSLFGPQRMQPGAVMAAPMQFNPSGARVVPSTQVITGPSPAAMYGLPGR